MAPLNIPSTSLLLLVVAAVAPVPLHGVQAQSIKACNDVLAITALENYEETEVIASTVGQDYHHMCYGDEGVVAAEASSAFCSSSETDRKRSARIGVVIKAIPIDIAGSSTDARRKEYCKETGEFNLAAWRKDACTESTEERAALNQGRRLVKHINNEDAIEAWMQCIVSTSKAPTVLCAATNKSRTVTISVAWASQGLGPLKWIRTTSTNLDIKGVEPYLAHGVTNFTFNKQDHLEPATFTIRGHVNAANGPSYGCDRQLGDIDVFCETPRFNQKKSLACGIASYNSRKDEICGGFQFLEAPHADCGVERHKLLASERCPVASHFLKRTKWCGCERHKNQRSRHCGRKWNGARKRCRNRHHPCELWKECRDPEHGAETYAQCRHPSHGPETNKRCRTSKNGIDPSTLRECARPEFGVAEYLECEHESHGLSKCEDKGPRNPVKTLSCKWNEVMPLEWWEKLLPFIADERPPARECI